jgi:hypothetical protein
MSTSSSFIACTRSVPVTARPSGVVLKYVLPAVVMWNAPHCSATRPFVHELGAAVDDARLFGAVLLRPPRYPRQIRLVVLAEVGGVRVRHRALLAHPRDCGRRVEAAAERDPDALADRDRREHLRRHER